jgi:uncharacterized membrane protein YhaH (DUF805 family)
MQLFTSQEGRIGRKTWWLATIGLAVVILIIDFVILPVVGLSAVPNMAGLQAGDATAASTAIADAIHRAQWVGLVIYVIFGWPVICIGVKRRHDKDNSGLDVMIFYGIAIVLNIVEALGIGYTTMDAGNGVSFPAPSMPLTIISLLLGIYAIYLLVVLGFLKGTTGANQYGPDPLLAGATVAA